MKPSRILLAVAVLLLAAAGLTGAPAHAGGPGPNDVGSPPAGSAVPAPWPTPPPARPSGLAGLLASDLPNQPRPADPYPLPSPRNIADAPSGGCGGLATVVTGSITNASPTEAGRPFRSGVSTTCDTYKANPGLNDPAAHHYKAYQYTNSTGADQCYTVSLTATCPENQFGLFLTTYLDSFDSAHPDMNYLADEGSSGLNSYSFVVPAGRNFNVVANEVTADQGCSSFTFSLAACACWESQASGAITHATPAQTNRLFRDASPSTCAAQKAYPGPFTANNIHYQTFQFFNNTTRQTCYTVRASAPDCTVFANMIFVSAYGDTYNPADMSANYVGDMGASPVPAGQFSISVPAAKKLTVVVTSVAPDDGVGTNGLCSAYNLDLARCVNTTCLPSAQRH